MLAAILAGSLASGFIASVEITPPEPLPLGGYTARQSKVMSGVGAPLFARAACISAGDEKVILLSYEGLTFPESLYQRVVEKLPPKTHLMAWATHTHCAPDSQMLNDRMTFRIPGIEPYSQKWLAWYADRLVEACNQALRSPVSGELSVRMVTSRLARLRRPSGTLDNGFLGIYAGDKPLLMAYSAHPTLLDSDYNMTSGDWPGAVMSSSDCLVATGAIGDASPNWPIQGLDGVTGFAGALKTLSNPQHALAAKRVRFVSVEVTLPKAVPHPEFAKENGVNEPIAQLVVGRFAFPTARLSLLQLGDTLVVGVPGEPTGEFAARLKQEAIRAGFTRCYVLSHVNGWGGYMLSPREYSEGGYEATLHFYGPELLEVLAGGLAGGVGKLRAGLTR